MKSLIDQLQAGEDLESSDALALAGFLLEPQSSDEVKADLLKALAVKGETPLEIAAIAEVFLERALNPHLEQLKLEGPTLDIVGTGGDRLDLFNVSTTSMFVAAGVGAVVTKHGNRSISSKCGGADVLEVLGVGLNLSPDELRECVAECGVGFLFAPSFHPAFKNVTELRRRLATEGVRTVFNLLGPLLNPARPRCQLIGVAAPELAPAFAEISQRLGRESVWVAHGLTADGRSVDELSLMGATSLSKLLPNGELVNEEIEPESVGLERAALEALVGGTPVENAAILESILNGSERGAKRDMVLLNAGAAITAAGLAVDLAAGIELARDSIDSGAAIDKLRGLQQWCRARPS